MSYIWYFSDSALAFDILWNISYISFYSGHISGWEKSKFWNDCRAILH